MDCSTPPSSCSLPTPLSPQGSRPLNLFIAVVINNLESVKRELEKASIPFTVVVEVLDIDLQLQLIAEGVGLGILAARALPQPLEEQGLQMFALSGPTFSLETWLLHRRTGPMTPVVVPVIEHTVATLLRQTTTFDTTARRGKKRPPEARQKA